MASTMDLAPSLVSYLISIEQCSNVLYTIIPRCHRYQIQVHPSSQIGPVSVCYEDPAGRH